MTTLHEAAQQALEALSIEEAACAYEHIEVPEHIAKAIEALREALAQQGEQQANWNRKIRDSVDSLLAQAGYAEDSSARHQLACMNFDAAAPEAQPEWSLLEATQESLREHMAMVKELRAKLAQQGEQQPYLHVYEYDSVQFGVHREFYPREWNGMKPTRTVPLYAGAAPAAQPVQGEQDNDHEFWIGVCESLDKAKSVQRMVDVAFEARRKQFVNLPRYSFHILLGGGIHRVEDKCGNWVEFDKAHTLFEAPELPAATSTPQPDARKVIEELLYCVEAWERGCLHEDYRRDRDDAIQAGQEWLEENKP